MCKLRFTFRLISVSGLIILYLLSSSFILLFSRRENRRKKLCLNCSFYSRLALKNLGINVRIKKIGSFSPEKNYFIVCNHLSYIDVLIISSVFPSSFVTSVEVEKDIFLGTMAGLGGSIFVERRNKKRLLKDLGFVSDVVASGLNVVVFPEGTSSNGESVLPFKKTLFRAAVNCGVDVLPLCLCYTSINGRKIDRKNRDLIFWYGDMKFFPHFMGLLKLKKIEATLQILQPFETKSLKSDAISKIAYDTISSNCKKFSQL